MNPTRRFKLTVSYTVELDLDARVGSKDLEWATQQTFHEWSDGRKPLPVEMMEHGLDRASYSFALVAHGALASRISDKYPGARQKSYQLEPFMPEPKLVRIEESIVRVDGVEYDGQRPSAVCMCGAIDPETEDIGDGLPRCVHCGCH